MNDINLLNENNKVKMKEFLLELFRNDIISFSFYKKDGSLRKSRGTLNQNIIKESGYEFKNTEKLTNETDSFNPIIKYFDIEKSAWRSFNIESLNEVMEVDSSTLIDKVILLGSTI